MLSGALIALSYMPFPPYALFISLVPLWYFALKQERLLPLLLGGWLCQCVLSLIGFNWLFWTIHEIGFSFSAQVVLFLVFCAVGNGHIPLSLLLWFFSLKILRKYNVKTKKWLPALLPIYLAISTEYYPMLFDWHLAYSWLYAGWPATQIAEIGGFRFLNTLTLLLNFLMLCGLLQWSQKKRKALCVWAGGFILFLLFNIYGYYLKNRWPPLDKKAYVLIVQPNIENQIQEEPKWQSFIRSKIEQQTTKGLKANLDFVLWPEGGWPYVIDLTKAQKGEDLIQQYFLDQKYNTTWVVSAKGKGLDGGWTNSLFVFDKAGKLSQPPYNKVILVPFGEYMPMGQMFPFLKRFFFFGGSQELTKGDGAYKIAMLNLNQTDFEQAEPSGRVSPASKGATYEVFPSYKEDVKHAFFKQDKYKKRNTKFRVSNLLRKPF